MPNISRATAAIFDALDAMVCSGCFAVVRLSWRAGVVLCFTISPLNFSGLERSVHIKISEISHIFPEMYLLPNRFVDVFSVLTGIMDTTLGYFG